jgi:deoxycytidylate deaminase
MNTVDATSFIDILSQVIDNDLENEQRIKEKKPIRISELKRKVFPSKRNSNYDSKILDNIKKQYKGIDMDDVRTVSAKERKDINTYRNPIADIILNESRINHDKFISPLYGCKAAIKIQEECPNQEIVHGCAITCAGGVIITVGYNQQPISFLSDKSWTDRTIHSAQAALLNTPFIDRIINGSVYLTHLPCIDCVKLLCYVYVSHIYYLEIGNECGTDIQSISKFCQESNIVLQKVNKQKVLDIIKQDDKDVIDHNILVNTKPFPQTTLIPDWLRKKQEEDETNGDC